MFGRLAKMFRDHLERRRKEKQWLPGSSRRRAGEPAFSETVDRSRVLTIFMLLLVWIVCTIMLTFPPLTMTTMSLIEGQLAPQSVFARESFEYIDQQATAKLIGEALEKSPVCFAVRADYEQGIMARLDQLRSQIVATKNPASPPGDLLPGNLPPDTMEELRMIAESPVLWPELQNYLRDFIGSGVVSKTLRGRFSVNQPVCVLDRDQLMRNEKPVEKLPTPETAAAMFVSEILKSKDFQISTSSGMNALQSALNFSIEKVLGENGNLDFDTSRTLEFENRTRAKVTPVPVQVLKGEPLVIRGSLVDAAMKQRLAAYEAFRAQKVTGMMMMHRLLGNAMNCLLLVVFVAASVWFVSPEVGRSNSKIALANLVLLLQAVAIYASLEAFSFLSSLFSIPPGFVQDAVPVGVAAAVIVPMIGMPAGVFASVFAAGIGTMFLSPDPELGFRMGMSYLICGMSVAMAVRHVTNYRGYAIRIMLATSVSLFLLDPGHRFFLDSDLDQITNSAILCLTNGLTTSITALIAIFVMELLFRVSTDMSLLLQSDITHPLLRELQLKAPGTYFHCQTVAVLAENAAKEIGANSLKCRVGALFHDIGKLRKPEYFTENNIDTANMHEDLSPAMSALILRAHVEDGVELARQHHLSHLVRDMIQQHHGTDLMRFFYNKALASGKTVLASQFCYPGPLPKEREVAIVSLADSCEAACRSLPHPTSQNIAAKVGEIFHNKIESGQLDHAELTAAELAKIRDSFIRTLTTMYHSRIAYPEAPRKEKNEVRNVVADEKAPRPQP